MRLKGLGLSMVAWALLASGAQAQDTFTDVYSQCTDICGIPTSAQVTAACSGVGGCSSGSYVWWYGGYENTHTRCEVTINWAIPGEKSAWKKLAMHPADDNKCANAPAGGDTSCGAGSKVTVTEKYSDTAETSYSNTTALKASLSAKINAKAAEINPGIGLETSYTNGSKFSSTKEISIATDCSVDAPCCGWRRAHILIWERKETGVANLTLKTQGKCLNWGLFSGWYECHAGTWEDVASCTATVNVITNRKFQTCKGCDYTCAAGQLATCCKGVSATGDSPCNLDTCEGCP